MDRFDFSNTTAKCIILEKRKLSLNKFFPRKSIIVSFFAVNIIIYYWHISIYIQWDFSAKAERSIMEVSWNTIEVSWKIARY